MSVIDSYVSLVHLERKKGGLRNKKNIKLIQKVLLDNHPRQSQALNESISVTSLPKNINITLVHLVIRVGNTGDEDGEADHDQCRADFADHTAPAAAPTC